MPETPAVSDPVQILHSRMQRAIRAAFPELGADVDPLIAPSKQQAIADYQCNAAMPVAKRVGKPPREVAGAIAAKAEIGDLAEPLTEASVAGPGFINIRLRADALAGLLSGMDVASLGLEPASPPETVVVDLLGVNLAKQMHVGHLRSPFVGDAIARTLSRLGHRVIRQNHVGDWGLPIAMVTARLMRRARAGLMDLDRITLDDLDVNYKAAQAECQRDLEGLAAVRRFGLGPKAEAELEEQVNGATEAFTEARQVLIKLQAKEPATFAVWRKIYSVTMAVCLSAAKRLNVEVSDADTAGESSYADELAPLVADLEARGIAEPDQGALIVRLERPEFGGIKEPCLVRKTDGGYLYATTDVAAIRRRVQKLRADRLIYAIDARQSLHMKQVFGVSLKAGYAINPVSGRPARMEHAAFGAVLGEDGRPFKTRSGENVNLQSLIDEAVGRARAAISARSPDLAPAELDRTAEAIGVAAMKYADLCNDRMKDYVFSFDRMLAFEGNTGPYLLYALVRIRSIFRKAAERGLATQTGGGAFRIVEPSEKQLALTLLRFPGAVRSVAESLEPHRLCGYLYDLAQSFSVFFDQCPVLTAPDDTTRNARFRLCRLTERTLDDGLRTLGIPTVDRM